MLWISFIVVRTPEVSYRASQNMIYLKNRSLPALIKLQIWLLGLSPLHLLISIRDSKVLKPVQIKVVRPTLFLQRLDSIHDPRHGALLGIRVLHGQGDPLEELAQLLARHLIGHLTDDDPSQKLLMALRFDVQLGPEPPVHGWVVHAEGDGVDVRCVGGIERVAVLRLASLGYDHDAPVISLLVEDSSSIPDGKVVSMVQSYCDELYHNGKLSVCVWEKLYFIFE
jgi:hypothetical protein